MYPNLRAEMARKNVTLSWLADQIKMHVSTLSEKMNGKANFSLDEAKKIKKALGVDLSIDDLFYKEEEI